MSATARHLRRLNTGRLRSVPETRALSSSLDIFPTAPPLCCPAKDKQRISDTLRRHRFRDASHNDHPHLRPSFHHHSERALPPNTMASNAPINIDVIESSKENIQSLPSGRSARALAQVYSGSTPSTSTRSTGPLKQVLTPSHSEAENDGRRAEFERELAEEIDDSDDPLDIYDRYVKWTLDAYPSAQGTAASGLLPLLERATQPFVSSPQYANDPRYLKLWMLYIKFFSDNVMETFRFLVQHEIGSSLALFYEEYAGWLEAEGRWVQAEEIYSLGLDRGARPVERLRRKYGEFRSRFDHRPADGPTSPAIPTGRAALTSKTDGSEHDPQAADRARGSVAAAKPKKSKMMIFSDADAAAESPAGQSSSAGIPKWDSLGSMQSRRKENTQEATAWAGATLKGGKRAAGPKLEIFRDEVS